MGEELGRSGGGRPKSAFLPFRRGTIDAYQSVGTYRRAGSERLERHGLSINELLSVQRLHAQPNLTHTVFLLKKKVVSLKNRLNSGRPRCREACKPSDSADARKSRCCSRARVNVGAYS